jgi:hypothetical protein
VALDRHLDYCMWNGGERSGERRKSLSSRLNMKKKKEIIPEFVDQFLSEHGRELVKLICYPGRVVLIYKFMGLQSSVFWQKEGDNWALSQPTKIDKI